MAIKRKMIVGLGNPGEKYRMNRHNAGFILVDKLAEKLSLEWRYEKKFNAEVCKNDEYILVKPQTFMNESGRTVLNALKFYKVSTDDLIVVHDDVDLPFGKFSHKKGSGTAGHHGVADIVEKLGSQEFWRFRVGVGRPKDDKGNKFDVQEFVLEDFSEEEISILKSSIFHMLTNKIYL